MSCYKRSRGRSSCSFVVKAHPVDKRAAPMVNQCERCLLVYSQLNFTLASKFVVWNKSTKLMYLWRSGKTHQMFDAKKNPKTLYIFTFGLFWQKLCVSACNILWTLNFKKWFIYFRGMTIFILFIYFFNLVLAIFLQRSCWVRSEFKSLLAECGFLTYHVGNVMIWSNFCPNQFSLESDCKVADDACAPHSESSP